MHLLDSPITRGASAAAAVVIHKSAYVARLYRLETVRAFPSYYVIIATTTTVGSTAQNLVTRNTVQMDFPARHQIIEGTAAIFSR